MRIFKKAAAGVLSAAAAGTIAMAAPAVAHADCVGANFGSYESCAAYAQANYSNRYWECRATSDDGGVLWYWRLWVA